MSLKLNFDFVSPMSLLFSGEVDSILIPAKEGDAEILPQHAPLMTALRVGIVEIKIEDNKYLKFLIDGGFADIASDKVTLLAERSFDLLESSKEEFERTINNIIQEIDNIENNFEKENLLIKKEILESNIS